VVDQRKQAVSIRLGESDIRNIKRIAKRLGVRDSDIIRFAIKSALKRIAPLCDPGIRGRNLVPVLVESVDAGRQVDCDDIALLAMSGLREEYLVMRLKDGNGSALDSAARDRSLRSYLYDKYVYRNADSPHPQPHVPAHAKVSRDREMAESVFAIESSASVP